MEQRLTRARQRLREWGDGEGAAPEASHDRLDAVLQTIALLFNEGYWSTAEDNPIRTELCRLAVGLGHSLRDVFPEEPEAAGLLALMKLHDARRSARFDPYGATVPLPEQDRTRWDHEAIYSATRMLEAALAAVRPGPFQIEAAISAVHGAPRQQRLQAGTKSQPCTFAVGRSQGPGPDLALLETGGEPTCAGIRTSTSCGARFSMSWAVMQRHARMRRPTRAGV